MGNFQSKLTAHAQKVQLITKSSRKDDRHDAQTLARLARVDPELLGPVRHRSVQAQIHQTVIRAQAELVSARTALVNAARYQLVWRSTRQDQLRAMQSAQCGAFFFKRLRRQFSW